MQGTGQQSAAGREATPQPHADEGRRHEEEEERRHEDSGGVWGKEMWPQDSPVRRREVAAHGREAQEDEPGRPAKRQRRAGPSSVSPPASPRARRPAVLNAPRHLLCEVCDGVLLEPRVVHGCGHECCLDCLKASVGRQQGCPLCGRQVQDAHEGSSPFRRLKNEVDELEAKCQYAEFGCNEVVRLGAMAAHCAVCPRARVACVHEPLGCKFRGTREQVATHRRNDCAFEELRDFVERTQNRVSELEDKNKKLEESLGQLQGLNKVASERADRLRRVLAQQRFGDQSVEAMQVVRVLEWPSHVTWWFMVRSRGTLAPVVSFLEKSKGECVVVSCDGPLSLGGTPVMNHQSLFDLGLEDQQHVVLFVQPLANAP